MEELLEMLDSPTHIDHEWCGNDVKGPRRHHGDLKLSHDPVTFSLSWKPNDATPQEFIGAFRLHIANLLESGFITVAKKKPGYVRVRFLNKDGSIVLACGVNSPALVVGRMKR